MSIRVLLADDHPIIQAGLPSVIEGSGADIAIVREAANGLKVLKSSAGEALDVNLLDIEMPGPQQTGDGRVADP